MKLRTQIHTQQNEMKKKIYEKNSLAHLHTHNRKNFGLSFFPSFVFFCSRERARTSVCLCAFLCNISFFYHSIRRFFFSFIHSFIFFSSLNRRCSTCTERIFNILFFSSSFSCILFCSLRFKF